MVARSEPSAARQKPSVARQYPSVSRKVSFVARAKPPVARKEPLIASQEPSVAKAEPSVAGQDRECDIKQSGGVGGVAMECPRGCGILLVQESKQIQGQCERSFRFTTPCR